ncbi:MAG TPA: cytidylate kinase-like family protein [Polyangia bacterium]|jgi:cytidylate kinase
MPQQEPFVVTISRQLGSGGAYLGQRVAARLGVAYADREILRRAAETLGAKEEVLASQDERAPSFWDELLGSYAYGPPEATFVPPPLVVPSPRALQAAEAAVIAELARTRSAVIVGRGGFHVLRDHPRHLSVFLHADPVFRRLRMCANYGLEEAEAKAQIEEADRARARHLRALTGRDWADARQYDLALNTSALGLEAAEEAIVTVATRRFGPP